MSDNYPKTPRLPLVIVITLVSAALSAGTTYGLTGGRLTSGEERDAKMERRIEKLEDISQRNTLLLERIDERTAEIKRQLDAGKH